MLALWEYFWDWASAAPVLSVTPTVAVSPTDSGGGHKQNVHPMDSMMNYDDLWAAREAYLRSLFPQPLKRQKAMEEMDWPEPILKPRRKR